MPFLPAMCDFTRQIACFREAEGPHVEWKRSGNEIVSLRNAT